MILIVLIIFYLSLISPPIDDYLDQTLPTHLVVQMGGITVTGILLGKNLTKISSAKIKGITSTINTIFNPPGISGLILFLGNLTFWMIPRSLDLAVLKNGIDQLLHITLLLSAIIMGISLNVMPFVLKTASGVYGLSMLLASGLTYLNYEALLCAVYDVEMQKETGKKLLWLFGILFILFIFFSAKNLVRLANRTKKDIYEQKQIR